MAGDENDPEKIRQIINDDLKQVNYSKKNKKAKYHKEKLASHKDKNTGQYHLAPKKDKRDFDINLIPEELVYQSQQNPVARIAALLMIVMISVLFVAAIYYYLSYQQQKINIKLSETNFENSRLIEELAEYKKIDDSNNIGVKKIASIGNLLGSHIYWTKFFNMLEKYTLDGVYFSSFSADTSGAISLPATAKDYATALKQITALKQAKDFAKEVKVDSMQMFSEEKSGATSVGFEIKVILNENIFIKQSNDQGNQI